MTNLVGLVVSSTDDKLAVGVKVEQSLNDFSFVRMSGPNFDVLLSLHDDNESVLSGMHRHRGGSDVRLERRWEDSLAYFPTSPDTLSLSNERKELAQYTIGLADSCSHGPWNSPKTGSAFR